jgi:3D (Asp-Asp-Asp) domain-containing protein
MRGRLSICALLLAVLLSGARAAPHWRYLGVCFITGYTSASGAYTAIGTPFLPWREVAVDPTVIPLRSQVRVAGLPVMRAEDTGWLVRGCHIDVAVASDAQAYALTSHRNVWWRP